MPNPRFTKQEFRDFANKKWLRAVLAAICLFAIPSILQAQNKGGQTARGVEGVMVGSGSPALSTNATMSSAISAPDGVAGLERRAFELINLERSGKGEKPLLWDDELCQMAREHSSDMARAGFFDHKNPDGKDTRDRARIRGIRGWHALGENIALNQGFEDPAASAVVQWMQSPGHRANILNPEFNYSAIGVARSGDGTVYLTQVFISR